MDPRQHFLKQKNKRKNSSFAYLADLLMFIFLKRVKSPSLYVWLNSVTECGWARQLGTLLSHTDTFLKSIKMWKWERVCVCVSVCMREKECVHACWNEREREREKESKLRLSKIASMLVCKNHLNSDRWSWVLWLHCKNSLGDNTV